MSKTMFDTLKDLAKEPTYEEWSSNEANKKKIKMTGSGGTATALDETENRAMYELYLNELRAENAKNDALEALEENRATVMRENAIMTERAKEYAERRAALNGTASAGVSQTAMIDLYSQMAGNRASAQAAFADQERGIIQEYRNAINQAQSNVGNISSAVAVERAAKQEEDEKTLTELSKSYTDISELRTGAEEFRNKYGYVPENIEGMLSTNKASQSQLDSWIEVAKGSSYKGKAVDAYDVSGNLFTQNLEDAGKFGGDSTFDLPNVENKYENKILRMIKGGAITDGTVIRDTNGKNGNFVYIRGKFYRIDNSQVENFGTVFDIAEYGSKFLDIDEKTGVGEKRNRWVEDDFN